MQTIQKLPLYILFITCIYTLTACESSFVKHTVLPAHYDDGVMCDVNCQRDKLSPKHIYKISDVKFTQGGRNNWKELFGANGEAYSTSAAAIEPYTSKDLLAVTACAADLFAKANGYIGWKIEDNKITEQYAKNDPTKRTMLARIIFVMYKTSLPDGINPLGTKNWCSLIPEEAK